MYTFYTVILLVNILDRPRKHTMLSWQNINTGKASQCFVRGYCLIVRKYILQLQSIFVIYGTRTWTLSSLFSRIPLRQPFCPSPVNMPDCVLISAKFCPEMSMTFIKCHGHFGRNKNILITVLYIRIFRFCHPKFRFIKTEFPDIYLYKNLGKKVLYITAYKKSLK